MLCSFVWMGHPQSWWVSRFCQLALVSFGSLGYLFFGPYALGFLGPEALGFFGPLGSRYFRTQKQISLGFSIFLLKMEVVPEYALFLASKF